MPVIQFNHAPSEQELIFAQNLALTGDPSESWLLSGYKDEGHKKNYSKAYTLSKKPKILERVKAYKLAISQEQKIHSHELIGSLKAIVNGNIIKFLNDDLTVKDLTSMPEELTACISSIKVIQTEFGVATEIKLYDKLKALDMLAKINNLFDKNNQANAPKITLNLGKQEVVNVIEHKSIENGPSDSTRKLPSE